MTNMKIKNSTQITTPRGGNLTFIKKDRAKQGGLKPKTTKCIAAELADCAADFREYTKFDAMNYKQSEMRPLKYRMLELKRDIQWFYDNCHETLARIERRIEDLQTELNPD